MVTIGHTFSMLWSTKWPFATGLCSSCRPLYVWFFRSWSPGWYFCGVKGSAESGSCPFWHNRLCLWVRRPAESGCWPLRYLSRPGESANSGCNPLLFGPLVRASSSDNPVSCSRWPDCHTVPQWNHWPFIRSIPTCVCVLLHPSGDFQGSRLSPPWYRGCNACVDHVRNWKVHSHSPLGKTVVSRKKGGRTEHTWGFVMVDDVIIA